MFRISADNLSGACFPPSSDYNEGMLKAISLSSTANRAFCITFFATAQVLTIARLWLRFRQRHLWWDDGWVFLTSILSVMIETLVNIDSENGLLIPISRNLLVVQYWIVMISFTVAIWCARLSLIFSIIRLIPPLFTLRRISQYSAVCFLLACAGILAPKIYVCASDKSWYHQPAPQCKVGLLNPKIAVGELITDLAADITLVAIPLCLLRRVSLSNDKKRMLIFVFGATLLTSLVSIVHVVFLVGPSKYYALVPITVEVEVGIALVVANLGVMTPIIYRLFKREKEHDSTPYSHYRSFQDNGDIHMRRVSDLVASGARLDTGRAYTGIDFELEPKSEGIKAQSDSSSSQLDPSYSDANPSDGDTHKDETPKVEAYQGDT